MTPPSLRNLVNAVAIIIGASTCVLGPLAYFAIGYSHNAHELEYRATIGAERLAKFIYMHPTGWHFQVPRLAELIEDEGFRFPSAVRRIVAADDVQVIAIGSPLAEPILARSSPITVGGELIGRTEIAISLRPLLWETGAAGLISCVLGFCMYFAVRIFPFRVLDRTLGDLQRARAEVEVVNRQLAKQNTRFQAALTNMSQGLVMFDGSGQLSVCNRHFAEVFGVSGQDFAPGVDRTAYIDHIRRITSITADAPDLGPTQLDDLIEAGRPGSTIFTRTDGAVFSVNHEPMADGGWVDTFNNITERRRAEARIAHLAHHDALTNLPNRVTFYERLNEFLARTKPGDHFSVFIFDFDDFKSINDTLGHPAGDALLRTAAERMRSCLGKDGLGARLGGDEFAVIQFGGEAAATELARRLTETVGGTYELEGRTIAVGISIGIAIAPDDGACAEDLIRNADLALYRAKSDPGEAFCFFETEMDARMRSRHEMEIDLRTALAESQFELHYQPLINLRTGQVTGLEALIRWNHPVRGTIQPDDFIPLAEDTGLVVPIGAWVLERACMDALRWPADIRVEVNVSPVQFKRHNNLLQMVARALTASGLPPGRLELEITERVLLDEDEFSLATLHHLRDMGVKIAMDDFGIGYSSLGYLRSFPFDKIKIDRSFVRDLSSDQASVAIIRAVVGMSTSLSMVTTVEGVETVQQLERLREEGCTEVQGFLFSAPRPANEINYMLSELRSSMQVAAQDTVAV